MVLTNPRPTPASAGDYYKSAQYISHQRASSGFFDSIYLIIRWFALRWKFNTVKPYLNHPSLLDIGCGTGAFLHSCAKKGVEVFGVEPNDDARKQAQVQNITVVDSISSLTNKKFSVITLWHVLEHIYDLQLTLTQLKSKLEDHGTIFIAVPNWQSPDAVHYKSFWAAYDTPRHAWHFSKPSMTRLLENNGFKLKHIIPMKMDAYYVSLLSEKYIAEGKFTIINTIKGLFHGYQSNRKARPTQNYSSLIYLAQK